MPCPFYVLKHSYEQIHSVPPYFANMWAYKKARYTSETFYLQFQMKWEENKTRSICTAQPFDLLGESFRWWQKKDTRNKELPFNMYRKGCVSLRREQPSLEFLLSRTSLIFRVQLQTTKFSDKKGQLHFLYEQNYMVSLRKDFKSPRRPNSRHRYYTQIHGWLWKSQL